MQQQPDYQKKLYELEKAKQQRNFESTTTVFKIVFAIASLIVVFILLSATLALHSVFTAVLLAGALFGIWHIWKKFP